MSAPDIVVVPFDSLPVLPSGLRHAWDVWGPGDNLGTLNRLTGAVVTAAMGAVRTGERIGLSLPMEVPAPGFFGRDAPSHALFPMGAAGGAWDDRLDGFYLQSSTQWDGLRHIRGADGFYGGWQGSPDLDAGPLGMQHWASQGIIGRGVLVDLASGVPGCGDSYDPFDAVRFDPGDLEAALEAQRTQLRYGDILCVRTGWMDRYLALDRTGRLELADQMKDVHGYTAAGLSATEAMARFLWDRGVAAVACDNPAVETVPADPAVGFLHGRLIPHLGFAIGELFDFGALAAACARQRRHEFLFVSVPLHVAGAAGSPGNAVAIL